MTQALKTPVLETPSDPIYLRSWARVPVRLPVSVSSSDPTFDDLLFTVDPPDVGCGVSHSRDGTFDVDEPHVILYTGSLPGEFTMRATDKRSGDEVASASFAVDYGWSGTAGPPMRAIGTSADARTLFDAVGSWKVAVVLLETTDVAPLTEVQYGVILDKFRNEIFDGVTVSGQVESAAQYLSEASWGRFNLENVGVVGPLPLTRTWDEIGPQWDRTRMLWRGVTQFSDAGMAEIITRNRELVASGKDPLVDLTTVESIIFVVRAFDGPTGTPRRSIWPWATEDGALRGNYDIDGDLTTPDRLIESIVMPDDWPNPVADPGGRIRFTAAHELSHNLGLSDQYTWRGISSDFADRDITSWSLMSNERRFPHLTAPERRELGWLDAGTIKTITARPGGAAVDETVTLRLASQRPRPREFTAVEIELSSSLGYFVEFRGKSVGTVVDRNHTAQVVGTEWTTTRTGRPNLLRMRNDADNDRSTYLSGEGYDESTTDVPRFPIDLKVTVVNISGDTATVRVQFGDRKPDPALTPFSAELRWQSPDIEVFNERNRAFPALRNIPWSGHANQIVARVRNEGNFDAPGVRVEYSMADFTLSADSAFTFLGADQRDVPAGSTVDFSLDWGPVVLSWPFPPSHYCLKADIVPYVHPLDGTMREINAFNNTAQSNYTQFISLYASPASREFGRVALWGDPRALRQHVNVRQTSPFARTFVDHRWLDLPPGQRRDVTVFTEFMVGDETVDDYVESLGGIEKAFAAPNSLDLSGVLEDGCSGAVLGGAAINVPMAQPTRITDFGVKSGGRYVYGSVAGPSGPAPDSTVLVSVRPQDAGDQELVFQTTVQGGSFDVETGHGFSGPVEFWAHYLGEVGWAACDSAVVVEEVTPR